MKIDEFIEQIKIDLRTWFEKLNLVIGAVALGFASLAYKSKHSELIGWFFIIILFAFYLSIQHYFPEALKQLRKKKNKSEIEFVVLKGAESHFLSFCKSFKEAPLLWIGIAALFAIANGFKGFLESKILPLIGGQVLTALTADRENDTISSLYRVFMNFTSATTEFVFSSGHAERWTVKAIRCHCLLLV